ncbi:hypothetical protein BFL38_12375 [Brachyspira hampsonii]|uniref:Uncharacterized protein n=1 Tax=Brachyspira hampsonii TaxID=1287055 RepID=A0A1E5NH95_9SPIR|nr:hypothetical protein BFL38_12375 [Brachyspira hampsonii]
MEEMASTIKSSAQNSVDGNEVMIASRNAVVEGGSVIADTTKMIEDVYESSAKIKDITKVIDGIAFQTTFCLSCDSESFSFSFIAHIKKLLDDCPPVASGGSTVCVISSAFEVNATVSFPSALISTFGLSLSKDF